MFTKHAISMTLIALTLGGLAAGCGSAVPKTPAEPTAKPATRAEWAQQADAICRRESDELDALSDDVSGQVNKTGFEAFAREVLATQERALAALRDVPAPPGDEAAIGELLGLQARANGDAGSAIDALVAGREKAGMELLDSANGLSFQSARLASELGAEACLADLSADDAASEDGSDSVLADDFSDPSSSAWTPHGGRGTAIGFKRGAYRISVNGRDRAASASAMLPEAPDRMAVAADVVQLTSGDAPEVAVVSCLAGSGPGISYDFAVAPDLGYYAITKVSQQGVRVLKEGRRPDIVRGLKRVNRVRGECSSNGDRRGTTVRLVVNGERLLTVRDRKGLCNFVGVGLLVYSEAGGTTAEFDNVVVDAL